MRVLQAGICNTDLEMTRGYYPFQGILGHEFVGVVEDGPSELSGKRVVGEINTRCGVCAACKLGLITHCENRTVLGIAGRHGAFAEYLSLPVGNLHPVPNSVATDAATFAEPLAAALQIQQQVSIGADDRVLVVGNGKLGLLTAFTLALTGCRLHVAGRHSRHFQLLAARGISAGLADQLAPDSYDIAVDCTGSPAGLEIALAGVRPRGILVLKSTFAQPRAVDTSALVVKEITLIGSRCGPFGPALELLAAGTIDVGALLDSRFPLTDGVAAFDRAAQRGALKVLLDISTDSAIEC